MKEDRHGSIGFFDLLTLAFIVLKLTGFIEWSWWRVLSPVWIPWLLVLVLEIIKMML